MYYTKIEWTLLGLLVAITAMLLIGSPLYAYKTQDTTQCLVEKSERITQGSGETLQSKYLVFCENEVLENTDSIWYWKFDSSDVYRQLEVGKEYKLKVYGWRVPFLSWYRNIVEIEL